MCYFISRAKVAGRYLLIVIAAKEVTPQILKGKAEVMVVYYYRGDCQLCWTCFLEVLENVPSKLTSPACFVCLNLYRVGCI